MRCQLHRLYPLAPTCRQRLPSRAPDKVVQVLLEVDSRDVVEVSVTEAVGGMGEGLSQGAARGGGPPW